MVFFIGTFLSVPDIPSFALISTQFHDRVVEGFCFEDLSKKLFPQINELYRVLPGKQKKSYYEKLKQQFCAAKKMRNWTRADAEVAAERRMLAESAEMEKTLQEEYVFTIRFDLAGSGWRSGFSDLPLKTTEKEDMVAAVTTRLVNKRSIEEALGIIKKDPVCINMQLTSSEVTIGLLDTLATKTLRELQDSLAKRV